jgi:hypothetical protein
MAKAAVHQHQHPRRAPVERVQHLGRVQGGDFACLAPAHCETSSDTHVIPVAREPTPAAGDGPGSRTWRNIFRLDQREPLEPEGVVVDVAPLPCSALKDQVQEDLSYGERIIESSSKFRELCRYSKTSQSSKMKAYVSSILASDASTYKDKRASKDKGSSDYKSSSKDTAKAGLHQEEPSSSCLPGSQLYASSFNYLDTDTSWDLDLPDDLPDHIARAIELCLSPDATPGQVQKGPSGGEGSATGGHFLLVLRFCGRI